MNFALSFLLMALISFACKEGENPVPDFTSGTIAFNYNSEYGLGKLYVVISDTTGKVLTWARIENGKKLELPYTPGDTKLLNVTLISSLQDGRSEIYTFTGIAGGDYSKTTLMRPVKTQTGNHVVSLEHASDYVRYSQYILGGELTSSTFGPLPDDPCTWTFGLTGSKNDLLVLLSRSENDLRKYVYKTNIKEGETTLIKHNEYESLPYLPVHQVNYPDKSDVRDYRLFLRGYDEAYNGAVYNFIYLDDNEYSKGETGALRYANTPGLFSAYHSGMSAYIDNDEIYTTSVLGPEPVLNFLRRVLQAFFK